MDINNKFQFIKDMLSTAVNLPCTMISSDNPKESFEILSELVLQETISTHCIPDDFFDFYNEMKPEIIYKIKNKYFTYSFVLMLPEPANTFWVFGPCLTEELSSSFLSTVMKFNGFKFTEERSLRLHYQSIPYIPLCKITSLCQVIANHCFNKVSEFPYEVYQGKALSTSAFTTEHPENNEILVVIKTIEERYNRANELLSAVRCGNYSLALSHFGYIGYEIARIQRNSNPLRNTQNLCIVSNSMFRKTAEEAKVPPIFIDQLSNEFGVLIEQAHSIKDLINLSEDMIKRYCMLIQQHNLPEVSPLIKQAATYIKINLPEDLQVKKVAKALHVNPDYLSQRFKQEMGVSFTDFMNKQRINQVVLLMKDNTLSLQYIAGIVGYKDINYFIKRFKKEMGCTPSLYRNKNF